MKCYFSLVITIQSYLLIIIGISCGGDNWIGAKGDFGMFCYKEMRTKLNFTDALSACRTEKGNLFSVLNAYENRYLQDNVIHNRFWLGYRDEGKKTSSQ